MIKSHIKAIRIFLLVLIIIGIGLIATQKMWLPNVTDYIISHDPQSEIPTPYEFEPTRMTLSGTSVCLPHKDTTGPQTEECAFGLKAENGVYYALDVNLMSQTAPILTSGMHFTASGTFTPIERLSSNHWQRYPIVGIFSITDNLEIK